MTEQSSSAGGAFSPRSLGPDDRFASVCLIGLAAIVGALLALTRKLLEDGDTGWHVGAGRYILDNGSIPATDPFSFTFAGHAWHAHEWLAEVVMAGAFNAAGWSGLLLLFAFAAGLTVFLLGRELIRWMAVRWAICALVVLCVLLIPMTLARPHMLAWPLLAGWLLILVHAREKGRAPAFAALPLMLVWANLHASYILGLGLAGLFALEALLDPRRDRSVMVRWAVFVAGACLAACITPHGVQGFLYPFQVSGMRALPVIREWRASTFGEHWPFLAVAAAMWVLIGIRWRRLPPLRILLLAGLTALAITHIRHQMLLVIVAAVLIGPVIAGGAGEIQRRESVRPRVLWIAAAATALLLMAVRLAIPFQMKDNSAFPVTALSHVPVHLRNEPVLNGYSFGGPLVLYGIRPFIDGRADMYGDDFTLDYVAMLHGDIARFRRADRRWRFQWTILPPKVGLVSQLDREPGWRRLYGDRWAVVHVRTTPPMPRP